MKISELLYVESNNSTKSKKIRNPYTRIMRTNPIFKHQTHKNKKKVIPRKEKYKTIESNIHNIF